MGTIRGEIARQALLPKRIGIVVGVALLPFVAGMRDAQSELHAHAIGVFAFVLLPVLLGAVTVMTWMTRGILCPRCRKPFGWSALRMYDRGRWSKAIESCPHCDVDLDERMPAQSPSARSR
ncbi:MAG TPA: hypothetical protein VNX02_09510 [Steroidobacteraceae bacterium]|jgi:hypothetical protein|nr:hypothetical protein [Steroidobacteraceae bacterium]